VPRSPLTAAVWDLGVSLVWREAVRQSADGRVTIAGGSSPVVFEFPVSLSVSDFELVMIAQEHKADTILTGQIVDRWPDPRDSPVSIGPINAVQPGDAIFVRGEETLSSGSLTLNLPRADLDLAKGERCELVRDTIPAGNFLPGELNYTIEVSDSNGQTASATRPFAVSEAEESRQGRRMR